MGRHTKVNYDDGATRVVSGRHTMVLALFWSQTLAHSDDMGLPSRASMSTETHHKSIEHFKDTKLLRLTILLDCTTHLEMTSTTSPPPPLRLPSASPTHPGIPWFLRYFPVAKRWRS